MAADYPALRRLLLAAGVVYAGKEGEKMKASKFINSAFCYGLVIVLGYAVIRAEFDMRSRAKENREYHDRVVAELQMLRSRPELSPEDIKRISDINFRFEEEQAQFKEDLENEIRETRFTK